MFPWPHNKRLALSLSFDDARPSQVDTGLPLLNEYGAKATFYAVPENVEKRPHQWRALAEAGHELGNHTVSHPCSINFSFCRENGLENYTLDRIEREIMECNQRLYALCGVLPETFAYPCGNTFVGRGIHTQSYVPVVARHFLAGRGFPSEWHNVPEVCDLAQLNGRSFDELPFEAVLPWIEQARQEHGWLILVGHDIGHENQRQTVLVKTLRTLIEYALNPGNGVWLDTVAVVARHISAFQEEIQHGC